jgi:hypothetical protein
MSEQFDKAMAEFLANGGVIQQGAYRESGRVEGAAHPNSWGAKKAGRPAKTDVPVPEEDFGDEE